MSASLRHAVLTSAQLPVLRSWLDLPEGRDDRDGWRLLHDITRPGSAQRAHAKGAPCRARLRIELIDRLSTACNVVATLPPTVIDDRHIFVAAERQEDYP